MGSIAERTIREVRGNARIPISYGTSHKALFNGQ